MPGSSRMTYVVLGLLAAGLLAVAGSSSVRAALRAATVGTLRVLGRDLRVVDLVDRSDAPSMVAA